MASITGTLNGLTTTARHYYMGSVTGTPTQVTKTSNNTYRLVMSQDFTNETRGETLILCDGTMTGCSVVSGSANVEAWGTDEYAVQHYDSVTVDVTVSDDTTWISVMPPGAIAGGSSVDLVFNGISAGSYWFRWAIVVPYTVCGAPTSVTLGKTLSSGEQVQLSWSGASAGNSNAITGYEVYRYESSDGASWGSGVRVGSVSTSATSGSLMVDPPSTYGNYYRFAVRTLGAAGASYYSGWTNSGNTLRRNHAPFGAWTDPTLTAGSTKVKAVHLSEMQTRVNTLLAFYGKSARSFTGCTSGATSLANWLTCITELRNAIDSLGVSHDTWIAVTVNKPTAAVMEQLRTVIMAI